MTAEIIKFRNASADDVLELAVGEYESVFVIGWDSEGYMDARGSKGMTQEQVLWLLECFKSRLLDGTYATPGTEDDAS